MTATNITGQTTQGESVRNTSSPPNPLAQEVIEINEILNQTFLNLPPDSISITRDNHSKDTSNITNNPKLLNKEQLEKIRGFFLSLHEGLALSINSNDRYVAVNPYIDKLHFDKDGCEIEHDSVHSLSICLCYATCGVSALPCYLGYFNGEVRAEIPEGIKQYAIRTALGVSYIYQEIIASLDTDSNKRLKDCFVSLITQNLSHAGIYDMLMRMISLRSFSVSDSYDKLDLKTAEGKKLSFNNIRSLGVRTIDGGKYEPMQHSVKGFDLYRWGTSDFIKVLYNPDKTKSAIRCYKETEYNNSIPSASLHFHFWRRTDALAQLFLESSEFERYVQQIPPPPTPSNYPPKTYRVIVKHNSDGAEHEQMEEADWRTLLEKDNKLLI